MPGISFIHKPGGGLLSRQSASLSALDSLLHESWIGRRILISTDQHFLGYTDHPQYPVTSFQDDEYFICLEGRIYDLAPSAVPSSLLALAPDLFDNSGRAPEKLSRWLLNTDGDFVIFVLHRESGEVRIINDALARLPLYWREGAGTLLVSRELRFITRFQGEFSCDRMALAQYLLLGFPLGKRTLLEHTYRLPPASLIRSGDKYSGASIVSFLDFNYQTEFDPRRGLSEAAEGMTPLFVEACRKLADPLEPNILTLSGGLDSRSVAAALNGNGIDFSAVTFLDHHRTAAADVDIARQLSRVLDFPWKLYPVEKATGAEVLKLLRMKNGMNFLGMSFSIPYFKAIREDWGERITYFTGEGGGLSIPDTRPFRKVADLDALTRFLWETNHIVPLETAATLTGLKSSAVFEEIRAHLAAYPESDMAAKYVHFIAQQRNLKWTSEGEDRNRFYFWTVSPFNTVRFFDFVRHCPARLKARHRLYRQFLLRLSSPAAAVNNANWGLPLSSRKYLFYLYARDLYYILPAGWKKLVRGWLKHTHETIAPYPADSPAAQCFQRQLDGCREIGEALSLAGIARHRQGLSKFGFDHLFTLTSLIEDLSGKPSSIEEYRDRGMI
ncbi:MAG: hypothetical protein JXB45_10700 [Candidatus Krumholzibacteriota bacterium]|nr:hypothetical protein [Candidatus Krumholzibacteriota bacterium]